jgi:hypothetical protein
VNNELERMWKEAAASVTDVRTMIKILKWSPVLDNQGSSEYEAAV